MLDADIRDYFGSIDHERVTKLVERRVSVLRVLKLVWHWLKAGVMADGLETKMLSRTPQGGVISPLLSNIYLSILGEVWERRYAHLGVLVRYCDEFVVVCRTRAHCHEAERRVRDILKRLKLELPPEQTRRVELSWGKQGFDFLGCHLRKRLSGQIWEEKGKRLYFLQKWRSQRSMKRVRQRVKDLTDRRWMGVKDVPVLVRKLNRPLSGSGNYVRTGNAAIKFNQLDSYVWRRLMRFMVRRKRRHLRAGEVRRWTRDFFHSLGLYRLRGTVQYPEAA